MFSIAKPGRVPIPFIDIILISFSGQPGSQVTDDKATQQNKGYEDNLGHRNSPEKQIQGYNMSVLSQND